MDNDDELVSTRLKKQVLDVAEKHVNVILAMISISETVLVYFDFARYAFTVHGGTDENIFKSSRLSIYCQSAYAHQRW